MFAIFRNLIIYRPLSKQIEFRRFIAQLGSGLTRKLLPESLERGKGGEHEGRSSLEKEVSAATNGMGC